jgi:hypothetical protein
VWFERHYLPPGTETISSFEQDSRPSVAWKSWHRPPVMEHCSSQHSSDKQFEPFCSFFCVGRHTSGAEKSWHRPEEGEKFEHKRPAG